MEGATREMTFFLAGIERRVLTWMAHRLPPWVVPDHLSALGIVAALGIGLAYAASTIDVRWLWVASGLLVVHWVGDSLDGTLARVRRMERPRYGYYLDHGLDAVSTALIGIGIGLSPFVQFELALGLVVVYLMLSVNVYLETTVFGVFRMAYGRFGPTEARLALIAGNVLLVLVGTGRAGTVLLVANGVAAVVGSVMFLMLVVRFWRNLRRLSKLEPSGMRRSSRRASKGLETAAAG